MVDLAALSDREKALVVELRSTILLREATIAQRAATITQLQTLVSELEATLKANSSTSSSRLIAGSLKKLALTPRSLRRRSGKKSGN